jgi:hypothetical protein
MEIVQGDETKSKDLFRFDEMADVTPGKIAAGLAGSAVFDWRPVERKLRVLQV